MKKLNILLFLLVISNYTYCQSLVDNTKLWSTVIHRLPSFTIMTESIKFSTDTVIDLNTYKKVLRSTDALQTNWSPYGYIRETIDKKVFYRMDTSLNEYLLYDFGVELGDTVLVHSISGYANQIFITTLNLVLTTADSIQLAGVYRKQYHFTPVACVQETDIWIEGIGNMSGMLHYSGIVMGGDSYELNCYSENSSLIYHNSSYQDCYIATNLVEVSKDENVFIYPNPVVDRSILKLNKFNNEESSIEIYDCRGSLIKNATFSNEFEINSNEFNPGIYVYRITTHNEQSGIGKIIIE